jgi:hypothetical protein
MSNRYNNIELLEYNRKQTEINKNDDLNNLLYFILGFGCGLTPMIFITISIITQSLFLLKITEGITFLLLITISICSILYILRILRY